MWTAGAVAALIMIAVFLFWLGAASVARHRASAAADLAALAAAARAGDGVAAACEKARSVTNHMRAEVVSCRLDGWDALVEVEVEVGLPHVLDSFGSAEGRARAGPVTERRA